MNLKELDPYNEEIWDGELKEPNYKGFGIHLEEWDRLGLPYGLKDMIRLAWKYNTPIPPLLKYRKSYI